MLFLFKNQPNNEIIVTVSNLVSVDSPSLNIKFKSLYDNKVIIIPLGDNTSEYKGRYDRFIIDSSHLSELNDGICIYEVFEDAELNSLLESGYARVIDETENSELDFVSIPEEDSKMEFMVYEKRNI